MVFETSRWRRFWHAAASVVAGEESVMRMKLAIASGVAAVILGTGTAAYAVVAQGWMNPTTTGNVLPIDDNHSPVSRAVATTPAATTTPAPTSFAATPSGDRGREAEPGDDRGQEAEPGDDRGQEAEPGDDRDGATAATRTAGGTSTTADDRGRGSDDGAGHR